MKEKAKRIDIIMSEKSENNILSDKAGIKPVYIEQCQSTNTLLKENAFTLPHLTTVYTGNQTGGKGRKGKAWECRKGEGAAVSVLLRNVPYGELLKLPVYAAVAAAEALEKLSGLDCRIKWPNDIICGGKKLCGILCEGCSSAEGSSAIIGFGVNLLQSFEEFSESTLPYAGSIKALSGREVSPKETAEEILRAFVSLQSVQFNEITEKYKSLSITIGKEVTVISGEERYNALAKDIDGKGQLIVIRNGEEITVNSGIASIRGLDNYS